MRAHVAEECKNDYAAQLQKYNKEQNQFYFNDMPLIFNVSELSTDNILTIIIHWSSHVIEWKLPATIWVFVYFVLLFNQIVWFTHSHVCFGLKFSDLQSKTT